MISQHIPFYISQTFLSLLFQIVRFSAQGLCRFSTSDIFRISGGTIRTGDSAFYHDIIHIPPLPPTRLDYCRLIDITYVLTVSMMHGDISMEMGYIYPGKDVDLSALPLIIFP